MIQPFNLYRSYNRHGHGFLCTSAAARYNSKWSNSKSTAPPKKTTPMTLLVSEYNRLETEALSNLPYPAIRAFRPAGFLQSGFPTSVTNEEELTRYCDIMSELEDAKRYYELELYSEEEAALVRKTARVIEEVTQRLFRSVQPFLSLFPPIDVLRTVRALTESNATVFEIGPGSGILGSYLIESGYRYRSIDNTQAFYLWQGRLFSALAGEDFVDYVSSDGPPQEITARCAMIPWWHFATSFSYSTNCRHRCL